MKKIRIRDRVIIDDSVSGKVTGFAPDGSVLVDVDSHDAPGLHEPMSFRPELVRLQDRADLLSDRAANHHLPTGHPDRVIAQRAVRQYRISQRSNKQWASIALARAQKQAASRPTGEQAAATLNSGIETAKSWLDGTHPLAR